MPMHNGSQAFHRCDSACLQSLTIDVSKLKCIVRLADMMLCGVAVGMLLEGVGGLQARLASQAPLLVEPVFGPQGVCFQPEGSHMLKVAHSSTVHLLHIHRTPIAHSLLILCTLCAHTLTAHLLHTLCSHTAYLLAHSFAHSLLLSLAYLLAHSFAHSLLLSLAWLLLCSLAHSPADYQNGLAWWLWSIHQWGRYQCLHTVLNNLPKPMPLYDSIHSGFDYKHWLRTHKLLALKSSMHPPGDLFIRFW